MNKAEYLQLKDELKSLNRRQYHKKQQLKQAVKDSEMDYRSLRRISTYTKELNAGRIKIVQLEQRLLVEKVRYRMGKAVERAFSHKPTIRDVAQTLFKAQGLFLHENNEVSGPGGKLVGRVDDMVFHGETLKIQYRPVQAVDFILVDVKI